MIRRLCKSRAGGWRLRRCFAAALPVAAVAATMLASGVAAGSAQAQTGNDYAAFGQYGEVARIGNFDSCWYDNGAYDGNGSPANGSDCTTGESAPVAGEFLDPQGFAVDAADGNMLFVLDRTSGDSGTTDWRVQELKDDGTVVGQTTFSLPSADSPQMISLAVDPSTGIVYSLVDDYNGTADVPAQIVAWSITPDSSGQLVAPTGLPTDSLATTIGASAADSTAAAGPGVVSTTAQLTAGPVSLYNPQGLALDVTGGNDDLVVEASSSENSADEGGLAVGPVIVQQVATAAQGGDSAGQLLSYWSSATGLNGTGTGLDALTDASSDEATFGPAGISTDPAASADGSLSVLLSNNGVLGNGGNGVYDTPSPDPGTVDVVTLSANLSSAQMLASTVNAVGAGSHLDQIPSDLEDNSAINVEGAVPPYAADSSYPSDTASPLVVPLSNGLYAANFAGDDEAVQTGGCTSGGHDPANPFGSVLAFWCPDLYGAGGSEGTRLLQPETDGTLSNASLPLTSVYDTLGNTSPTGACALDDTVGASYAAGADGTVFVLIRQDDSSYGTGTPADLAPRQIIELAPLTGSDAQTASSADTQAGVCPTASGTFTVADANGTAAAQSASDTTPLTIKTGDTVDFDANTIAYPTADLGSSTDPTATPFAFEWNPGDGSGTVTEDNGAPTSDPDGWDWPLPTWSHTYTTPGTYEATLNLLGDYGTDEQQGTIIVDAGGLPTAALAQQSVTVTTGQTVTFNAGNSTPYIDPSNSAEDAKISSYEWNFDNGQTDDTSGATDTTSYSQAGTYHVTLQVRDNDQQVSAPVTETVNVVNGAPTASVSASPSSATTGQSVSFTAAATAGVGSSISGYGWSFGDGTTANTTTPSTSHAYTAAGTYTVTLTVSDADGQTATSSATVTVTAPATVATSPPTTTKTTSSLKLSPANDVLKAGVTSALLVLQVKSLKAGTKLSVKLSEPGAHAAKAKTAKAGAKGVIRFGTGKLPAGKTTIRFYETVGKGKKAKLKLVKTETVTVKKKKK